MGRVCSVCGKGPAFGNHISHAHNKSGRVWRPNIQRIRVLDNGRVCRKNVCTRCIRSGRIQKAM